MILAEALVRGHVEALQRKMPNPDVGVLGCTHYPLMAQTFQEALGAGVRLFSQANLVAASLSDYLSRHPDMIGSGKEAMFLTTGDPQGRSGDGRSVSASAPSGSAGSGDHRRD